MKKEILSNTIVAVVSTSLVGSFWWLCACVQPYVPRLLPPVMYRALTGTVRTGSVALDWLLGPTSIPVWLYLLLAATPVAVLCQLARSWFAKRRQNVHSHIKPLYHAFTTLNRFSLVWRWDWAGKRISCVCAFCPQCDRRIRYDEDTASHGARPTILYCPHCTNIKVELPGKYPQIISDVTLEIEHAVRTGEWRQHLRPAAKRAA